MIISVKEKPKEPVIHTAGGAILGTIEIEQCCFMVEESGLPFHNLSKYFITNSVGALPVLATCSPHRNDSNKPALNIHQLKKLFMSLSSKIFPHTPHHHKRQITLDISSSIGLGSKNKDIHYDISPMEETLRRLFGHATMYDLQATVFFSTYKISPDIQEPYIITNMDKDIIEADSTTLIHAAPKDLPAYEAAIAGMSFPSIFKAKKLPYTNTYHIDNGHLVDHSDTINMLQENLSNSEIVYARIGNITTNRPIPPDEYNQMGIGKMFTSKFLHDFPSFSSKTHMDNSLRRTLKGKDRIFLFERSAVPSNEDEKQRFPEMDELNSTKEQIDKCIAFARESIEIQKEQYMRFIDIAVEAHNRRTRVNPFIRYYPNTAHKNSEQNNPEQSEQQYTPPANQAPFCSL